MSAEKSIIIRSIIPYHCRHITEFPELKEWTSMTEPQSNERADSLPCLVVDIERKFIRNCFPEPSGMFQDHLPVGWTGEYVDNFEKIESLIPEGERFWKE